MARYFLKLSEEFQRDCSRLGLSLAECWCLCAYHTHANLGTMISDPSLDTVSSQTGMSKSSVQRSIRRLVGMGILIRVRDSGPCNSYRVVDTRTILVDRTKIHYPTVVNLTSRVVSLTTPSGQPDHPTVVTLTTTLRSCSKIKRDHEKEQEEIPPSFSDSKTQNQGEPMTPKLTPIQWQAELARIRAAQISLPLETPKVDPPEVPADTITGHMAMDGFDLTGLLEVYTYWSDKVSPGELVRYDPKSDLSVRIAQVLREAGGLGLAMRALTGYLQRAADDGSSWEAGHKSLVWVFSPAKKNGRPDSLRVDLEKVLEYSRVKAKPTGQGAHVPEHISHDLSDDERSKGQASGAKFFEAMRSGKGWDEIADEVKK